MILYQSTSSEFRADVDNNRIVGILTDNFNKRLGYPPQNEVRAWTNSLRAMESIVRNSRIADDCGVLVEYGIPLTSRRIDFVVTGEGQDSGRNVVIVELKQWQSASATPRDGIVKTLLGGDPNKETTHPSYQAQTYKILMREYNENVDRYGIAVSSCAYLHNYPERNPEPLRDAVYREVVADTPVYFSGDAERLQQFLKTHVGRGKGLDILYEIQSGRIRPSRKLADHVCGMLRGNPVFTLIDEQKVAYEKALELSRNADEKTVLIVEGGPGTGKSVVAVNLFAGLLNEGRNTVFVAPNAAFRDVMVEKLARENKKRILHSLFKGSAAFLDFEADSFDVAVVDEAHRLKAHGAYGYKGVNQIRDILRAARCTILFIDEKQRVRPEDIGTVDEIKTEARLIGARVFNMSLDAQFRCSGAEGYLNWLDNTLQIRETANFDGWDRETFDFRIFDDPNMLHEEIRNRNRQGFSARLLAGYAWPWTSKGNKDAQVNDVVIEEHGFRMPWNSRAVRTTWAIDERGLDQVGCIHTSQGLEFDYVGVLVGKDLRFDRETMKYSVDRKSYFDKNGKKGLAKNPERLCDLVRNIYKVLMSRGIKGCYVYFVDKDVEQHFRERLGAGVEQGAEAHPAEDILVPFVNSLPLIDIRAVANSRLSSLQGRFPEELTKEFLRVEGGPFPDDCFLVRAEGDSMEPLIPDGSLCRFQRDRGGSRKGKIVLVLLPEYAGGAPVALIKRYQSSRRQEPGIELGEAEAIILSSINHKHDPILCFAGDDISVVGVFETVI